MMGWLLVFCVFAVGGAGLYRLISQESGYLLIVWGDTSIETSIWFALLSIFVILLIIWLCISVISGSWKTAVSAKNKVFHYGDAKAQRKTEEGLIEFIEGNWSSAHKKLTRSANKVAAPLINYLAAARSAYEMGDKQGALALLHKAESATDRGRFAVVITQARMQFFNSEFEKCLATLERATALNIEHPEVLLLRQKVYVKLKDWTSLKALIPQLKKNKIHDVDAIYQIELQLYSESLQECLQKNKGQDKQARLNTLNQCWEMIPRSLKKEESLLLAYAYELMAMGEHDLAEKILSKAIHGQPHPQWINLYGLLLCADPKKPLTTAERWLDKNQSPELLLTLGRLCLQNKQWGRAVDFFEKSLAQQESPEAYAELARLLDYMGENKKSDHYCKKGLLASTTTLADNKVLNP